MQNTNKLKASILVRCAESKELSGYTHDSRLILEINLGDYCILAKILCNNISLIYKLGISQPLKDELLRDMRTIRTILEKSEKEVVK